MDAFLTEEKEGAILATKVDQPGKGTLVKRNDGFKTNQQEI